MNRMKRKQNRTDGVAPCKKGHNRWKTIRKNELYQCRICGEKRKKEDNTN